MVKEKNSDSVKYSYYSTVRVSGMVRDEDGSFDIRESKATVVNYNIAELDKNLRGTLKFDTPIHMKWLEENFENFFRVYWRDSEYKRTKKNLALLDFRVTDFSPDALTVEFEVAFYKDNYESGTLHFDVAMSEDEYS